MNGMDFLARAMVGLLAIGAVVGVAQAQMVGEVTSAVNLLSPNHVIQVEAFQDPDVPGVVCHVSRARAGGWTGWAGLADNPNEASIACRQVGPIEWDDVKDLPQNDQVFSERRNVLFKTLRIARLVDTEFKVLVYLVYTRELFDGSPKNVISSVPVMPWRE